MKENTKQIIQSYYDAFNRADMKVFFNLMTDDIIHDINQSHREQGKDKFRKFMDHMNRCYQEKISDIHIFISEDGSRAAAEFTVEGTYLITDDGFPAAKNQTYKLPAGAFFTLESGKIARVTNYYNVKEWIDLISA